MCNQLHTSNFRNIVTGELWVIQPMPPRSKSGIAYKWMEERYEGLCAAYSGEQYTQDNDGWVTWEEEPDKAFSCFATEWEARRATKSIRDEAVLWDKRVNLWEIEFDDACDEHLDKGLDYEWRAFLMVKRFRPIRSLDA